jgi:arginine:ornithine antiporter / lysine permease
MTATESQPEQATGQVSLPTLTAMVVGSMIGSGVFLLPRRFGAETGVLGAIIAWTIAGTGMLMLAFVFQRLAMRKPQLDAGIFAYAKAGFGDTSASIRRSGIGHPPARAIPRTGCLSRRR